jgi:hypothetical protein
MKYTYERQLNKRALVSYAVTCVICIAFLLFIDIRFGLTFLVVLFLLPVASAMLGDAALKKLQLSVDISGSVLSKGDSVQLTLSLTNESTLGFAFLHVMLYEDLRLLTKEAGEMVLAFSPNFQQDVLRTYQAKVWGAAHVGIRSLYAHDFLGLFEYPITFDKRQRGHMQDVQVLAAVPEVLAADLSREAVESSASDEDEEAAELALRIGGMPGFEHREYVPGDSFKKINWKLSAKQDNYMVRLDEPMTRIKPMFVLDYMGLQPENNTQEARVAALLFEEKLVEGLLGFLNLMTKQYLQCVVYYAKDGKWLQASLESESDVVSFQYILSEYRFSHEGGMLPRIPEEAVKNAGVVLLFTNTADRGALAAAQGLQRIGTQVKIVMPKKVFPIPRGAWHISANYEFTRM